MGGTGKTVLVLAPGDSVDDVCAAVPLDQREVDEVIVHVDDDSLDVLQDLVYDGGVGRIVLRSLDVLGPDLLARGLMLGGWDDLGVDVVVTEQGSADAGVDVREALDSLEEYGKVPWIP